MRIWCQVPPSDLCNAHLLGEHRELHAIWNILRGGKTGYRNHPEVKRWLIDYPTEGRRPPAVFMGFLLARHEQQVEAMRDRGFNHDSPIAAGSDIKGYTRDILAGRLRNDISPSPWDDQLAVLASKGCDCRIPPQEEEE